MMSSSKDACVGWARSLGWCPTRDGPGKHAGTSKFARPVRHVKEIQNERDDRLVKGDLMKKMTEKQLELNSTVLVT